MQSKGNILCAILVFVCFGLAFLPGTYTHPFQHCGYNDSMTCVRFRLMPKCLSLMGFIPPNAVRNVESEPTFRGGSFATSIALILMRLTPPDILLVWAPLGQPLLPVQRLCSPGPDAQGQDKVSHAHRTCANPETMQRWLIYFRFVIPQFSFGYSGAHAAILIPFDCTLLPCFASFRAQRDVRRDT